VFKHIHNSNDNMPAPSVTYKWSALSLPGNTAPKGRAAHSVNVFGSDVYIFSGEEVPRIPVDNNMEIFNLETRSWKASIKADANAPSPRVGHATARIGDDLYLFGGRGGVDMAPLPNDLYVYNFTTGSFTKVEVQEGTQKPAPRSFHAMAATKVRLMTMYYTYHIK
jgi:hypothetical protein